jgi:hypothetical protein
MYHDHDQSEYKSRKSVPGWYIHTTCTADTEALALAVLAIKIKSSDQHTIPILHALLIIAQVFYSYSSCYSF